MPKQPPNVNGVMTLTDTEITDIKTKLLVIQNNFVQSDDITVCNTFYLTSNYNLQNDLKINGDTCEFILGGDLK